jgi:hypothetical protein
MSANNCGGCGQPTTNRCASCNLQHYCGRDCQEKHWAKHKSECKDLYIEHALKRVAHILHEAFLKFRQNSWDRLIDKVVTTPDEILIYAGTEPEDLPIKFQHGLMDDEKTKMAVLTDCVRSGPAAILHDLLKSLLKGLFGSSIELFIGFANSVLDLDVKVEELRVGLKTIPRPARLILPNNATKPCVSNPKLDLIL